MPRACPGRSPGGPALSRGCRTTKAALPGPELQRALHVPGARSGARAENPTLLPREAADGWVGCTASQELAPGPDPSRGQRLCVPANNPKVRLLSLLWQVPTVYQALLSTSIHPWVRESSPGWGWGGAGLAGTESKLQVVQGVRCRPQGTGGPVPGAASPLSSPGTSSAGHMSRGSQQTLRVIISHTRPEAWMGPSPRRPSCPLSSGALRSRRPPGSPKPQIPPAGGHPPPLPLLVTHIP